MAFFGYGGGYLGGSPYGFGYGFGAHPSGIHNNINYITGNTNATSTIGGYAQFNGGLTVTPYGVVNGASPQNDNFATQASAAKIQTAQTILDNTMASQGMFARLWDGLKSFTCIGSSSYKCKLAIKKAKNGEIPADKAVSLVSEYRDKQKGAMNLFSGILAGGAGLLALKISPSGASQLKTIGYAALIGAGAKAGFNTIDRATNDIDGDALDGRLVLKDGLQGALDGAVIAGVVSKSAPVSLQNPDEAAKLGAISGAKSGAISGAAIGAGDYTIDCAFGEQSFDAGTFVNNTVSGALTGAAVGAVAGGYTANKAANPPQNPPTPPNPNPTPPNPPTPPPPPPPPNPNPPIGSGSGGSGTNPPPSP